MPLKITEKAGLKAAMGLLAFERGVGTLGQVASFTKEFDLLIERAKETGKDKDPIIRQKIGEAYSGLKVMRFSALRTLSHTNHAKLEPAGMTSKLYWSAWHKKFTELGMEICGASGLLERQSTGQLEELPWMYLNARADSIYGGTNQIQRNIVSEHALGMPREPRGKA